jgi:hypothetical protein
LQPAFVDPQTGYRYFGADQPRLRRRFDLALGLDEIREIIEADDPSFTRARLVEQRARGWPSSQSRRSRSSLSCND